MQGDSYSEEADKECEQSFYAQPVQDTQPPDPSALLRPRHRYPWPVSVSTSDYKRITNGLFALLCMQLQTIGYCILTSFRVNNIIYS